MNLPNLTNKKLFKIPLSYQCKSIILGSLLGNGSLKIYKGYKNARLSIRHSIIQKEYFDWKVDKLKEISSVFLTKQTGFSSNCKLLFQSICDERLTDIHYLTYSNNKLNIKRSWLNHLSAESLMIWWLDDGSLIGGKSKGVLCTDGFSKESVQILMNYLEVVWEVKSTLSERKFKDKSYYRIYFSTSELKKFFLIIMPYLPVKSMKYKVEIKYKDKELQERWISIMNDNFKFIENDIVQ